MTAPTPHTRAAAEPAPVAVVPAASAGRIRTLWNWVVAGIAVVVGLLPHVLHHIGFLAGTAVVAGAGGAGSLLLGLAWLLALGVLAAWLFRRGPATSARTGLRG
jgi:hypothetical protein